MEQEKRGGERRRKLKRENIEKRDKVGRVKRKRRLGERE